MKHLISRYCGVVGCFEPPEKDVLCRWHDRLKRIGSFLMGVVAVLIVALVVMTLSGCAGAQESGPSKARLRDLLSQCREANRERVRIIKAYRATAKEHPEQAFGSIDFDEAGN